MKKTIVRYFLLLSFCLASGGCYRIRYELAPPSPRGEIYTDQRWNNYFLFGFAPSNEEYTLRELCRNDETKEIRSYRTPGNVIATIFAGGLAAASTLEVSCHTAK